MGKFFTAIVAEMFWDTGTYYCYGIVGDALNCMDRQTEAGRPRCGGPRRRGATPFFAGRVAHRSRGRQLLPRVASSTLVAS